MKSIKFLHMADVHIDAPFTSLCEIGAAAIDRRLEQRTLFKKIINMASENNVDFVLISGDLFEHEYVSKGSIAFINECFKTIPEIKVFISPGNHDPFVHNSYYSFFKWAPNVYIFGDSIENVYLEELNTSIYGVGFGDFYVYDSKLKGFKVENPESINILVTHGTIDSLGGEAGYHTISTTELEHSGLDYIALGHIHKYIPGLIKQKACYPGSPIAMGFNETGSHGVILGSIADKKLETEFIPIDVREYITVRIDVSHCSTYQEVISKVRGVCISAFRKQDYCRAVIEGTVNLEIFNDIDLIEKAIKVELNDYMLITDIKIEADYNFEDILKGNDLKALYARKIISLIENENSDSEKQKLLRVLRMGLSAIDGKKVKLL